jgi:hypothetical protein
MIEILLAFLLTVSYVDPGPLPEKTQAGDPRWGCAKGTLGWLGPIEEGNHKPSGRQQFFMSPVQQFDFRQPNMRRKRWVCEVPITPSGGVKQQ